MGEGVGIRVLAPASAAESIGARLVAAMAVRIRTPEGPAAHAVSHRFGIFDHIIEAQECYKLIFGGSAKPQMSVSNRARQGPAATLHSAMDGQPGPFVDIGAVTQAIGSAFGRSQVEGMDEHCFNPIWARLPMPGYMGGGA